MFLREVTVIGLYASVMYFKITDVSQEKLYMKKTLTIILKGTNKMVLVSTVPLQYPI